MINKKRLFEHKLRRKQMYWQPKNKRPIRIADMSDKHIRNVIHTIRNHNNPSDHKWCGFSQHEWLKGLDDEIKFRNRLWNKAINMSGLSNKSFMIKNSPRIRD